MNTLESISVERSLRYAIRPAEKQTKRLVYLLHGYGQLAFYFLKKVEHLLTEDTTLVAPEGMHRFYLEGTAGRVGASWMTKEARELDITENTRALDKLHEKLQSELDPEQVIVLGFSQGGATAARWIANGHIRPTSFISWASVFPPDISFMENTFGPETMQRHFVLGTIDPYFQTDAQAACQSYNDLGFDVHRFEGAHDLDPFLFTQLITL